MSFIPGRNARIVPFDKDKSSSRTASSTETPGRYSSETGNVRPGIAITGTSAAPFLHSVPRYAAVFSVLIVALIMMTNKSSRNSIASLRNASARSVFTERS